MTFYETIKVKSTELRVGVGNVTVQIAEGIFNDRNELDFDEH